MQLKYNTTGDPRTEIEDIEIMTDVEWEIVVAIQSRLHNPDGHDVIGRHRFCASPRFQEEHGLGMVKTTYRLPGDPRHAKTLETRGEEWKPESDTDNIGALIEEAKRRVTVNPRQTLTNLHV